MSSDYSVIHTRSYTLLISIDFVLYSKLSYIKGTAVAIVLFSINYKLYHFINYMFFLEAKKEYYQIKICVFHFLPKPFFKNVLNPMSTFNH